MTSLILMSDADYIFKLVVIGDSGVGKTNLLLRYALNTFVLNTKTTIGVEFRVKTLEVDGKSVKLEIWDSAGQERFRALTKAYFRGSAGILLLYDITSSASFNSLQKWMDEMKMYVNEDAIVILIGNKCDLNGSRVILESDAKTFAEKNDFLFLETSAKESINVDEAFNRLVNELVALANKKDEKQKDSHDDHSRPLIKGKDISNDKKTKDKQCC